MSHVPEIPILCQTTDFIAIDKPAGISVHNDDGADLISIFGKKLNRKVYPVHRLDKETSGVQLLALNETAATELAKQFQSRSCRKIYVGIARGKFKIDKGSFNSPLTDKSEGRMNPQGKSPDRFPCETKYLVINSNSYFSYVEFDLITGRQHQIRKHCALAKHQLIGDSRYGDVKYNRKMADHYQTERMFLHCHQIEILSQVITSPLPDLFLKLIDRK